MPPQESTPSQPTPPNAPMGPTVGIIIIVILMALGALYFWGSRLNHQNADNPPAYIPGDAIEANGTVSPAL